MGAAPQRTAVVSLVLILGLLLLGRGRADEPGQSSANFVRNGGFEEGVSAWRLTTDKGEKGGTVVQEEGGNHALCAEGDTYWVGATDYVYFRELHLEKHAGKTLRIACDVKGDEDAYPGLTLTFVRDGKPVYQTVLWKVQHHQSRYPKLTSRYQTFETTFELPAGVTQVSGLTLYNCTRRGRMFFDNVSVSLAAPKPPAADAPAAIPADWMSIEFTDEELIELSNTCNALIVEWALLYGAVADVERAFHYSQPLDPGQESAVKALQRTQRELLDKLRA
ncbi:MAG: hypothetical protein FJ279_30465, partial [Planctomycetes bacterium]|nr:hypothetical protein [Planctomycetota bacterium]